MKDKSKIIGVEKHVRITNTDISDQIDRLMELPEYKSFNKVVNDALFYGLPKLTESIFGEVKLAKRILPRKDSGRFYCDRQQQVQKRQGRIHKIYYHAIVTSVPKSRKRIKFLLAKPYSRTLP